MVTPTLRAKLGIGGEIILLFLFVLALSLIIFITNNSRLHNAERQDSYVSCIKDKQIADNQRRVILAILTLADNEFKEGHPQQIDRVKYALSKVPVFECKK